MNNIADQSVGFGRIAVMIPVKDMNRAYNFYNGALGFEKVFENGNPVWKSYSKCNMPVVRVSD